MRRLSSQGGYSAQVKMRLLVNGDVLSVAQMGPDFLLVDKPIDHLPCNASLTLRVDQDERSWDVHLPQGISATSKRVPIALLTSK